MTNPTELLPCPKGWRLVPVEPTQEMLEKALEAGSRYGVKAMANIWSLMLSAAPLPRVPAPPPVPAPVASEDVERVRPLIEAIAGWERRHGTAAYIAPDEYEAFCRAIMMAASRGSPRSLTTPARAVSREEVEEAVHRVIVRWSNGEQPQSLRAMIADALLALIGGE